MGLAAMEMGQYSFLERIMIKTKKRSTNELEAQVALLIVLRRRSVRKKNRSPHYNIGCSAGRGFSKAIQASKIIVLMVAMQKNVVRCTTKWEKINEREILPLWLVPTRAKPEEKKKRRPRNTAGIEKTSLLGQSWKKRTQ